jgi:protein arginine kinase
MTMTDELIVATGVALRRNEAVLPFPHTAGPALLEELRDRITQALDHTFQVDEWEVYDLEELPEAQRAHLVERGLVTPGFNESQGPGRALAVYHEGRASIEINGTDHVHLLSWRSGECLTELWATLDAIDDTLEQELTYAFDEHWGYLTAQPQEAGTGLRAHATVHLPGLLVAGRLGPLSMQFAAQNLSLTPLWEGAGGLFQVSNQGSRGIPEVLSIQAVGDAARQLAERERSVRKTLLRENPVRVRDYIGRALGVAQQAWSVGASEGLSLISAVRVGVEMGLVVAPDLTADAAFSLMRRIQPGHLAVERAELLGSMDETRLDQARAAVLRATLAGARASH